MKHLTKEERSWYLYDCGNSAYSMTITATLFPIYLSMFWEGGSMAFGYYNSIASFIVAFLSPILGTLADFRGYKKKLFTIFSLLGILASMLIAIVPYYPLRKVSTTVPV